jgi:hypothetical protein
MMNDLTEVAPHCTTQGLVYVEELLIGQLPYDNFIDLQLCVLNLAAISCRFAYFSIRPDVLVLRWSSI